MKILSEYQSGKGGQFSHKINVRGFPKFTKNKEKETTRGVKVCAKENAMQVRERLCQLHWLGHWMDTKQMHNYYYFYVYNDYVHC